MSFLKFRKPFFIYHDGAYGASGAHKLTLLVYLYQHPGMIGRRMDAVVNFTAEDLAMAKWDSFDPANLARFRFELPMVLTAIEKQTMPPPMTRLMSTMSDFDLLISGPEVHIKLRHGNSEQWRLEAEIRLPKRKQFFFNPSQIDAPYSLEERNGLSSESHNFIKMWHDPQTTDSIAEGLLVSWSG